MVSTSVEACSLKPRGSLDRGGCSVIVRALLTLAGSDIDHKRQDATREGPRSVALHAAKASWLDALSNLPLLLTLDAFPRFREGLTNG